MVHHNTSWSYTPYSNHSSINNSYEKIAKGEDIILPVSATIMLLVGIIIIYGSLAYFLYIALKKKKNS